MSNQNQSKFVKFLSSKGFYIALAVCIMGTGAAAWVAIDSTANSISAQDEKKIETPVTSEAPKQNTIDQDWGFSSLGSPEVSKNVEQKTEDVPVEKKKEEVKTPSSSSSASSKPSATPAPSTAAGKASDSAKAPQASQEMAFCLPVLSEVFSPFSEGNLIKSKTLGDWRTHDGIDIKAARGTQVMACADGVIANIYEDALWGTSVEIEHQNGLVSVYNGLAKDSIKLKSGDAVKVKDVLGTVDRIPCEISLQSHLHFGIRQAGKWINPVKAMGLE